MSKAYKQEIKIRAKAMWILGKHSDAQIASVLGIRSTKTIETWRRKEDWNIEREIIQEETNRMIEGAIKETMENVSDRHLKEFQLLQTKGINALQTMDPANAHQAASMIEAGIKGEILVKKEQKDDRIQDHSSVLILLDRPDLCRMVAVWPNVSHKLVGKEQVDDWAMLSCVPPGVVRVNSEILERMKIIMPKGKVEPLAMAYCQKIAVELVQSAAKGK